MAKKIHKCEMCGKPIEVGETYSYETGKWDGDFFDRKMHLNCFEMFTMILHEMGENEFDWDGLSEWWRDNKCWVCKHRYLPCNPDGYCGMNMGLESPCSERTSYATCKAGDTCDEMTHICWCEKFEPVTEDTP